MKRTAFVTGATGFLGLNLVEQLTKTNWDIYCLHRPTSNLKYLDRFQVNKVMGSIDDYGSLENGMPLEVDAVFHMAANTSMWSKNNDQQYRDNVIGTRNMVNCALAKKAKRFIHTSSIAAFGRHSKKINESTPSNALTSGINYYVTKYQAEEEVIQAYQNGLDVVILNPIHIMGPYDTHNWSQVIQSVYYDKLPGIPTGKGMFCHGREVAKAHLIAVDKGKNGERYLLGGMEVSFLELINEIQSMFNKKPSTKTTPVWALKLGSFLFGIGAVFTNKEPQLTPEKVKIVTDTMTCDDSKARDQLSYQHTSIREIVSDSYEWMREEKLL
ncbi:NAD-dependent epimerase/dehydratase family protein [Fulvivirgaceae bacterium BMA10]|uniref:NAD-dependent epimerase/dehydratase family protein n=1 Tax=Splendidivirga corallicola TaxID=3051826 RepID=A0ABT8KW65_9BACT|nr:NAD-dependent epimerase/dehydratase family protein [Fulvivirgaceae bacterium BMA10]